MNAPRAHIVLHAMIATLLPLAALGWSLLFLLLGGGLLGAIVIFVLLKTFKQ